MKTICLKWRSFSFEFSDTDDTIVKTFPVHKDPQKQLKTLYSAARPLDGDVDQHVQYK